MPRFLRNLRNSSALKFGRAMVMGGGLDQSMRDSGPSKRALGPPLGDYGHVKEGSFHRKRETG